METGGFFILLSSSILLHFVHTEREFVLVNQYLDWTSAQTYCREKFTDLVTVYNQQENQKLVALAENNDVNIWIGLRQNINNWRWSMGVPPLSVHKGDAIWGSDQPDNLGGSQHCALVKTSTPQSDGVFDRACTDLVNFICFDGTATENYILVNTTTKTWPEAQDYCRTNHDDLASVSNVTVLQTLLDMLTAKGARDAWIGLYRDPLSTWSDNTNTTFYNWDSDPTFYPTDDPCVSLSPATGKWHASLCATSYPFVCFRDSQKQTILKVTLQSGVDLNNMEIQQQILEQLKNRLGPVAGANVTVKWRATTKTSNPAEPVQRKCATVV